MDIQRIYQFIIKGPLGLDWKDWFPGMSIEQDQECTILTGYMKDHSELYGVFNKLRDLGLIIESVQSWDSDGE